MSTAPTLQILWQTRADLAEVAALHAELCVPALSPTQLLKYLRQRNVVAKVARNDSGRLVGFLFYELHRQHYLVSQIGVAGDVRRHGIGRQLLEHLRGKLRPHDRPQLRAFVPERDLATQQFFAALGMRCTNVVQRHFPNGDHAYVFRCAVAPN